MEIKPRRWLAALYQCPNCGGQTARTLMTPTKRHREYIPECHNWQCRCNMVIVERRYYTTFVIEASVSFTTIAGTLARVGPCKVCDVVHPNVRAFRRWVEQRQAEQAEQHQRYMEEMTRREAEGAAQHERRRREAALLKEAETVAYRRTHAVELLAEQIARAVWPEEEHTADDFDIDLVDLDDNPF